MRLAAIVFAMMVLAPALVGCGAQTAVDEASQAAQPVSSSPAGSDAGAGALMVKAKSLALKNNELGLTLWEQGEIMEVILAPDLKALEPALARCRRILERMRTNEKAIAALLDQVVRLDVSEELTTYAAQQKEIARLQLLALVPQEDFLTQIESRYREKGKPSEAELEKLLMGMGTSGPDDPLVRLEDKGHASMAYFRESGLPERYYINNGFGEANATSTGTAQFPMAPSIWYEFEGPKSDGADPYGSEGSEEDPSFVGVEAYPWETRGTFDVPVAQAMQDQRSVLERAGWSVAVESSAEGGSMTARKDNYEAALTFKGAAAGAGKRGTVVIRLTAL